MGALDLSLGALVVSTYFSFFETGIVFVVAYRYFVDYPKDPLIFKLLAVFNLTFCVTDTIAAGVWIYNWTVTNYANPVAMTSLHTASWINGLCIGLCSLSVQSFYAYRVWLISIKKNWWIPASILCASLAQFSVICWFVNHWINPAERRLEALPDVFPVAYGWLVGSVVADMLITSSIVYYLRIKVKARQKQFVSSRTLVIPSSSRASTFNRIIYRAVQANALSLLCQVLLIVIFKANTGLYFFLIDFSVVKVYTFSLLCSLCGRKPNSTSFDSSNEQSEGGMPLGTLPRRMEVRVTQDRFHDSQKVASARTQKVPVNNGYSLDDLSQ